MICSGMATNRLGQRFVNKAARSVLLSLTKTNSAQHRFTWKALCFFLAPAQGTETWGRELKLQTLVAQVDIEKSFVQ